MANSWLLGMAMGNTNSERWLGALQLSPRHESHREEEQRENAYAETSGGEKLAMTHVKRRLGIRHNRDLPRQRAFREWTAVFVEQALGDVAEFVDETGDAGIG